MNWYLNLWRLFTLFIGISMLYYGAMTEGAPDWDLGVSFLMAVTTYLLMPAFEAAIRTRNWVSAAAIATVCSDTTYSMYWDYFGNCAASQMVNYPASLSLFLSCWVVWSLAPEVIRQFGRKDF